MSTEENHTEADESPDLQGAESTDPEAQDQDTAAQVGPIPFEAAAADLPADPESIEFAQALQALKPLFGSRTEYNFMVCDQLALRGMSPNGLNVRKAGSWGAPVAIGADVKAWYTALSARLSSEHAKIPEASRRSANSLLEQLWTLAQEGVGSPLAEKLAEAETALATERDAHLTAMATTQQEHRAELESLRQAAAEAANELNSLHVDISQTRADLADTRRDNEALVAEVATLRSSIAEAALTHEREKREMAQAHEVAMQGLRAEAKDAAQEHARSEAALREQLAAERTRLDEASKAHALTLDGFRQDLRAAMQRGDQALAANAQEKAVASELREQLASATVERSKLERQASDAKDALERSRQHVQELDAELDNLKKAAKKSEPK